MDAGEQDDVNRVVAAGRLSRDAEVRELPSGDRMVLLRLVTRRADGVRVDSLPVAVGPAPGRGQRRRPGQAGAREVRLASGLAEGERVRIEGRLERRFWDAGGQRRSRLQVAAENVTRL